MAKARTGTMRQRKSGVWQLIVSIDKKQRLIDSVTKMDRLGQRILARQRQYETFHGTETEAQARLAAMQAESVGADESPLKDTVAGLLADWMRSESYRWKDGTKVRYRGLVSQHIVPFIGSRMVASLKARDMKDFYATLREQGRSEATIASVHSLLTTVFVYAIDVQEIELPKNPCDRVKLAKVRRAEVKIPSKGQIQDMLALAEEEAHPLAAAVHLAVFTGMRRGEIAGLTWEHVNLATGMLEVRQTLGYADGVAIGSPKSESSNRDIDLDAETVEVLQAHRVAQDGRREAMGGLYDDQDIVFATPGGLFYHPGTFTDLVASLSRRTGRHVRFHDLRHFHASEMINAGINVVTVSKRLGHASVSMTLNVYSHLVGDSQKQAADTFAAAMNGAQMVPMVSATAKELALQI